MSKRFKAICITFIGLVSFSFPATGAEMSSSELMQELRAMKSRIEKLETALEEKDARIEALTETNKTEKISDAEAPDMGWLNSITLSGAVEVEAGRESMDYSDPLTQDTDSSDIALATVELGIDADINDHVSGHVLLLWEEDDTEPVDLDEGFISISGGDRIPMYVDAGKMYVPFGSFGSHFISDPLTLEIGETRESAIKAGFSNDIFDISISFFNGDIDELTDDDEIGSMVGSAVFTLPEERVPGFGLSMGVSYISNIADSDGLSGEVAPGAVNDYVSGIGFFASVSIMERFFIEAEYLGAADSFAPGELSFDNGLSYKPRAYNFEMAWSANDELELGVKYEGGSDLGDFLPEKQYGCVLSYSIFENTSLGIEYLHGEFENSDERDLITTQLAIEF